QARAIGLALCAVLLASSAHAALADVIVLKETDEDNKPICLYGAIVKQGSDGKGTVVMQLVDGTQRVIAESKVARMLKTEEIIDERELEQLDPESPDKYFEVGRRYAEYAGDPQVRACAEHLLQAVIELEPEKFAL